MKTKEELAKLYEQQLKPALVELEKERKDLLLSVFWSVLNAAVVIWLFFSIEQAEGFIFYLAMVLLLPLIYFIYKVITKKDVYRAAYKQRVVKQMVALINSDWHYKPKAYITEQEYRESMLFQKSFDRYRGDDRVEGLIDKTAFAFSELHTEYKTYTQNKGRTQVHWHTIFKGLFVYADFNKEIKGYTFVLPDVAENLFGKWGQKLQKFTTKGKLIKMENPVFEKLFVVYGNDQIESRYVLTPTMMEAMVNLKQKYKRSLYFSFVGSRVYVAMSFTEDLFEPSLFQSGVDFKRIVEMNDQLSLIQVIVEEMNLNTRIWTKQ